MTARMWPEQLQGRRFGFTSGFDVGPTRKDARAFGSGPAGTRRVAEAATGAAGGPRTLGAAMVEAEPGLSCRETAPRGAERRPRNPPLASSPLAPDAKKCRRRGTGSGDQEGRTRDVGGLSTRGVVTPAGRRCLAPSHPRAERRPQGLRGGQRHQAGVLAVHWPAMRARGSTVPGGC